jgi:hypothetical protein
MYVGIAQMVTDQQEQKIVIKLREKFPIKLKGKIPIRLKTKTKIQITLRAHPKKTQKMLSKGGEKKKKGHLEEQKFNEIFDKSDASINYSGKSADCFVTKDQYQSLLAQLNPTDYSVSLKSGKTMQFHLGNVPELSDKTYYKNHLTQNAKGHKCGQHHISFDEQEKVLKSREFWEKYLKKGSLFCYKPQDNSGTYLFFNMDDIINFIISKLSWRLLETGCIKGDIDDISGIITFKYRDTKHDAFLLGATGGKNGEKWVNVMSKYLTHVKVIQS